MAPPSNIMVGKRGLIVGIANDRSIAWGIAKRLAAEGAGLALTYQSAAFARRVEPLAEQIGADMTLPCDASDLASLDHLFGELKAQWGSLDFLVHSIAYSDKDELKGRFVDTTGANFLNTMQISCFSFTDMARRARPLMADAGGRSERCDPRAHEKPLQALTLLRSGPVEPPRTSGDLSAVGQKGSIVATFSTG